LYAKMRGRVRVSLALMAMLVLGGVIGAVGVNATFSNTSSAVDSQYSCDKGVNFFVSVDNSAPAEYYAVAGMSTLTQNCGTLVYGGPTNAGSATGTNATQVIQAALNALPTGTSKGGGVIMFEQGNYTIRTLALPVSDHSSYILEGQGDQNTLLTYLGSNTKPILWEPWTFAKYSVSHLSLEVDNLNFNIKSGSYTYKGALDFTIIPELAMNHVIVAAAGTAGMAGSIGLKHDVFGGDGNAKQLTDVHISGFSTDVQWMDDHVQFNGIYLNNYLKVGIRFGNVSGISTVDNTMINPHIQNDNALLSANQGIAIQFNSTSATHGVDLNIINPDFESPVAMQCAYDFRSVGGSHVIITGGTDATTGATAYPKLCLPVNVDMSKVQFHSWQAPGVQAFPYLTTCNYFGISSSRITCTGSGRTGTPTSGVPYQDILLPTLIQISGGTGVNITINSPTNTNVIKNLATIGALQPFELPVGYKLIVTYSTPPTTVADVVAN
jgi:hypothetical protein